MAPGQFIIGPFIPVTKCPVMKSPGIKVGKQDVGQSGYLLYADVRNIFDALPSSQPVHELEITVKKMRNCCHSYFDTVPVCLLFSEFYSCRLWYAR